MPKLRLPKINDFDDPRLIDDVIIPLKKAAEENQYPHRELSEELIISIYKYVERRWKSHISKLIRRGITNIAHDAILSEMNNRLARSMETIEWSRSPKEIRGYILQQINYGIKEADRNSGKRSRREHKYITKAAKIISTQEQQQGRLLSRSEIAEVVKGCVPETKKTKWQDIAQAALDNGVGITKKQAAFEDNGLENSGASVVEVSTENSAEEAWFTADRMETLNLILAQWIREDLTEKNKEIIVQWLEQQNSNMPTKNRIRKATPNRVIAEISDYEKKCLFDRCTSAGLEEIKNTIAAQFFESQDPKQLRWNHLFKKMKKYNVDQTLMLENSSFSNGKKIDKKNGYWVTKCSLGELEQITSIKPEQWGVNLPDVNNEELIAVLEICKNEYQVVPGEALIYSSGRIDIVDAHKRTHLDINCVEGEDSHAEDNLLRASSSSVQQFFEEWNKWKTSKKKRTSATNQLLLPI